MNGKPDPAPRARSPEGQGARADGRALAIDRLAAHTHLIPILAGWFVAEWPSYYGPGGPGDATLDLVHASSRDRLPIALIALDDAEVVGTAALKPTSLDSHRHLSPWLAALLVRPDRRRQGIGTRLVAAVEAEARRLGFGELYTATGTAPGIVERRGWARAGVARLPQGAIPVYRIDLSGPAPPG